MKRILFLILMVPLLAACNPSVEIFHSPIIAKSSETVTFAATVRADGDGPATVEIYVNAALVETCTGLVTGDTCVYTGGPFATYEGGLVEYRAVITDSEGNSVIRGWYWFAVTDGSYNWALSYMPARQVDAASLTLKENLIFHMASDYASFADFVDDVEDKIHDVLGDQEIVEHPTNLDTFNFWVYSKVATSSADCGTVHPDADADMPWRDDDAILHVTIFGDCTNPGLTTFTAEGSNTKAFLHEAGHAVFGMADEYNGPTLYFEPPNEPNIWDLEAGCRAEQTAKGRDPDECSQFTTRQGGWWGIHALTDGTVMQVGNVGDPWGIEADEHMEWYFDQF